MHCYTLVTGCYHRHKNDLTFMNVLKKYAINEDIVLDYVLHKNAQTSTKDWIGIFPRGWTNLQQYLTFEYALVAPREASLQNRSILFLHTFHQEASPNVDYQFVYVSKQIQILGTSSYFRFILSPDIRQFGNNHFNQKSEKYIRLAGYPPAQIMSDDSMTKSCQQESSMTLNGTLSSHSAGVVSCLQSRTNGIHMEMDSRVGPRRICQNCQKPMDDSKLAMGRSRFLASHNNSLVARVAGLEKDLELAEGSVKHARMARVNLTNRLRAYESFVTEMLRSLTLKGIVKIIDAQGKEIILKRVNSQNLNENPKTDVDSKNESEVIEEQEDNGNIITDENRKDLTMDSLHIEKQSPRISNSETTRFVRHEECVNKFQTTANIRTQTANITCDKYTETIREPEFFEIISENKNNEKHETRPNKDTFPIEISDENLKEKKSKSNLSDSPENCHREVVGSSVPCIEHDRRDVMSEEKFLIRAVKILTENERENEDSLEILPRVDTSVKPSAIVLRDGNMKFAIIRY